MILNFTLQLKIAKTFYKHFHFKLSNHHNPLISKLSFDCISENPEDVENANGIVTFKETKIDTHLIKYLKLNGFIIQEPRLPTSKSVVFIVR